MVLDWIKIMPVVVEKVLDWDREVLLLFDESKEMGEEGWMEVCVYYPGELDVDWDEQVMSRNSAQNTRAGEDKMGIAASTRV